MSKWGILGLLACVALGIGLWVALDPNAKTAAGQAWNEARVSLAQAGIKIDNDSLLAPIAGAFNDFADSVGRLWSPETIRIEVPSIQLPH